MCIMHFERIYKQIRMQSTGWHEKWSKKISVFTKNLQIQTGRNFFQELNIYITNIILYIKILLSRQLRVHIRTGTHTRTRIFILFFSKIKMKQEY